MKKILVSLVAAGALVAGVAATTVITGGSADAQEAPVEEEVAPPVRPERGAVIQSVLDELVAANEITQDQADAIQSALEEKWAELKEDRPEGRRGPGFRRGARFGFHLAELLEDGVIDSAELAELPDGHPFNDPDGPFADAAADGQITEDELAEIREQHREEGGRGFGRGFRGGTPDAEGSSV